MPGRRGDLGGRRHDRRDAVHPRGHVPRRIVVADICGESARADLTAVPRVVFSDPEVAGVGMTEQQARNAGVDVGRARITSRIRSAVPGRKREPRGEQSSRRPARRMLVGAWAVAPLASMDRFRGTGDRGSNPSPCSKDTVARSRQTRRPIARRSRSWSSRSAMTVGRQARAPGLVGRWSRRSSSLRGGSDGRCAPGRGGSAGKRGAERTHAEADEGRADDRRSLAGVKDTIRQTELDHGGRDPELRGHDQRPSTRAP